MKNIFYDKSKIDYGNLLFPRRALWMLLIPLIIEQMLNSLMGMVDTLMVSQTDCAYRSSDFICYYDYWRWLSKAAASFDIRKCRRSCYD